MPQPLDALAECRGILDNRARLTEGVYEDALVAQFWHHGQHGVGQEAAVGACLGK